MTTLQAARELRAEFDADTPGWRDVIRRTLDAFRPGWVVHSVTARRRDGTVVRVALLANPERVPDPAEIDPETDPFAGWR